MNSLKQISLVCLVVFLLTGLASAQLKAFEEALSSGRLSQAESLLKSLGDGPERILAECEYLIALGRLDKTFALTDRLAGEQIPPKLLAKFHYIKADQETILKQGRELDTRERVLRMVREGLRYNPPDHDLKNLLMYRLSWLRKSDRGLADEDVRRLADISTEWGLKAKAKVARAWSEDAEALLLTRALYDRAVLEENPVQVVLQGLKLASLTRSDEESLKLVETLEKPAAESGEPYLIVEVADHKIRFLAEMGKNDEAESFLEDTLGRLPEARWKARLIRSYLISVEKQLKWIALGRQAAVEMGDRLVEAVFLDMERSAAPAKDYRALTFELEEMLAGQDLRGVQTTWYGLYPPSSLTTETEESETTAWTAVSRSISDKLYAATDDSPKPERIKQSLDLLAQEAAARPAEEIANSVVYLLSSVFSAEYQARLNQARTGFYDSWVYRKFASDYLRNSHPELVDHILDGLARSVHQQGSDNSRADQLGYLAAFLNFLERHEEALGVCDRALSFADSGSIVQKKVLEEKVDALLSQAQYSEAAEILAGPLWDVRSRWNDAANVAWSFYAANNRAEAFRWARKAEELFPPDKDFTSLRFAGVADLIIRRIEETEGPVSALQRLEGFIEREKTARYPDLSELYLLKAGVLARSGQIEEASRFLKLVGDFPPGPGRLHRDLQRKRVALEMKDEAMLRELSERIATDATEVETELGDPRLAYFFFAEPDYQELSRRGSVPGRAVAEGSLGTMLERLEVLRRREPDNDELRRLSSNDLRKLVDEASPGELFVQPLVLESSVVFLCLSSDNCLVLEKFGNTEKLVKSVMQVSVLSANRSDSKLLEEEREYVSRWMVAPWRRLFPEHKRVYWVGEGELQELPLSQLTNGGRPLIADTVVTFLDGPATQTLDTDSEREVLLVGGALDLDGAARELEELEKLYGRPTLWQVGDGMEGLAELAGRHGLVHIATHGVAPDEERLGGEVKGTRGSLDAFRLADLRFPSDTLAVISACEGGRSFGRGHDNSSLISALRTAGAEMVVGSVWKVDDQVGAELFLTFHRELRKDNDPAAALARAQWAVRELHPHPFYWAGVRVVTGP